MDESSELSLSIPEGYRLESGRQFEITIEMKSSRIIALGIEATSFYLD